MFNVYKFVEDFVFRIFIFYSIQLPNLFCIVIMGETYVKKLKFFKNLI